MKISISSFLIVFFCTISCTNKSEQKKFFISSSATINLIDAVKLQPNWSKENSLVILVSAEPDNLHPIRGNSSPRTEVFFYTQAALLKTDVTTGKLIPSLVESLPLSLDSGKRYLYKLKPGLLWSNGDTLNNDDIAFTIKANKLLLTCNPSTYSYWKQLKDIQTDKDGLSFQVVLKDIGIQNISLMTSFPVLQRTFHDPDNVLKSFSVSTFDDSAFYNSPPKELVKWADHFNDPSNGHDPKFLNGLGNYKVKEWIHGQYIRLEKKQSVNQIDKFSSAFPEKITFKIIKDDNAALLAFRNQEIDASTALSMQNFFNITNDDRQKLNYTGVLMPTYNYTYLMFNEKPEDKARNQFFNSSTTRKAIARLVPMKAILQTLFKEYSNGCKRMITNVSPLKAEFDSTLKAVEFNSGEASQMLAKDGWSDEDRDGILDRVVNGKKIIFSPELLYLNTSSDWKDIAVLIASELKKAGIDVRLTPVDLNLFLSRANDHDFDLLLGSWSGTILPEDYTQLWHSSSWIRNGSNYSGFGNAESDALIDSIRKELNEEKRNHLSHRLQKAIYDDQPCVFLYSSLRKNIIHERFGNRNLFSERPGMAVNLFRLLTNGQGILQENGVTP